MRELLNTVDGMQDGVATDLSLTCQFSAMSSSSEVRAILQGNASDDHELWIVKAPKMDVSLHGMTVDFSATSEPRQKDGVALKVSKKKGKHLVVTNDPSGECIMSKSSYLMFLCLLFHFGFVTSDPISTKGEILLTEEPPLGENLPPIPDTSAVKVKQPRNLISRHPLLGYSKEK
jgi:hypothetical protein